ncbi:MAG: hypothetical protein FWD68_08410 [Alphaproteobacteria bacterium]|nr:hypothetical protein [Alphaproteobacteria bacterium]
MIKGFGAFKALGLTACLGLFAVGVATGPAKAHDPVGAIVGATAGVIAGAAVGDPGYFYGGRQYCWYDDAWQGPGYYWCGYAWRRGAGWGGPAGWRGWHRGGGGHAVRGGGRGGGGGHGGGGHGGGHRH